MAWVTTDAGTIYARATSGLGSAGPQTLMVHAISTTAQGIILRFDLAAGSSYTPSTAMCNGSNLYGFYADVNGNSMGTPDGSTWLMYVIRYNGTGSTLDIGVYNGSTWSWSFDDQGADAQTYAPAAVMVGTTGATANGRTTANGLKCAYLRFWNAALTDGELQTEYSSPTAVKSGVVVDDPMIGTLSVLTGSGSYTVNNDAPSYISSAVTVTPSVGTVRTIGQQPTISSMGIHKLVHYYRQMRMA